MIERRSNGRYKARLRGPDGKEISQTFDLRRDAAEWAAAQKADLDRGVWVDARLGKQRFIEFADEWADSQDTWKQTTVDGWPPIHSRLEARVGDVPLVRFDPMVLRRLRADLAKTYAPRTVKLTMAYAGMILRAAYASRRIGFDPTAGLRAKRARADERADQVGPDDVPTRAEALAIIATAPVQFRAGVALGFAGLRVGEVLGLTADRLDLAARLVTVDRQLQRVAGRLGHTTPKAEKVRTIEVPGLVAVELRRHLRDHQSDGILFRGLRGAEMMRRDQWYDSAWRPALRAAGLPEDRFVFHAARHWCASTMLAESAPITAVAGHLGDTVETVSRVYAHWLRDDRHVPAEVLDRVMAPASMKSGMKSDEVMGT